MQKTNIEWCDTVWNVVTGCNPVSPGCKNCYAETYAHRFWKDRKFSDVRLHPERLNQPSKLKKPSRIFVNSMSDLFHKDVPFDFIDKVFDVMYKNPQHTFLILTKRVDRTNKYINERAVHKSFGWSPEDKIPFSPNSIRHIDDISMRNDCGYVCKSYTNNGYGCNHPAQEDREKVSKKEHKEWNCSSILDSDNSEGRCFTFSCPIAYEVKDRKTLEKHDLADQFEFDEDGYTDDTDWMSFHIRPKNAAVSNVWLGVSIENQEQYDKRIHAIAGIKQNLGRYFKVFISFEPLLSAIDFNTPEFPKSWYDDYPEGRGKWEDAPRDWNPLSPYNYSERYAENPKHLAPLIDWVICGGESGHKARPMESSWAQSLRDQCVSAKVPFFFKQWGEFYPYQDEKTYGITPINYKHDGGNGLAWKIGKKNAGRLLDGIEWNQFPGDTINA